MGEEKGRDWEEGRERERFGGGKGEGKIGGGKAEEGREGRGKYLGEGRERERLGGGEGKSERLGRERERLGGGKGEGEEGEEHGVMDIHTCILRGNHFHGFDDCACCRPICKHFPLEIYRIVGEKRHGHGGKRERRRGR